MCARDIQFKKYSNCGHEILIEQKIIDCQLPICYYSSNHPADHKKGPCSCTRWMTNPERRVVETPDGLCDDCKARQQ
ncbi:hypothetical protein FS837_011309 [Tulasnella sp. UAMH 9824]|nr:hypothetical protein FS837_011309 [Tulasnella sp. UAMH 9824]